MTKENRAMTQSVDEVVDSLLSDKSEITADMQNERIEHMPLAKLTAFKDHPFKVNQDDEFNKLLDSIKENGVLMPLIARPQGDKFELIAGHRRKLAAAIAGLETLPVLIRSLTDEQAVISMVDSNVQRENVLPSEKAFAYKMKLDALNRQLGRPSEKEGQVVPNYSGKRSTAILGENTGDSYKQVQRYIRLTELIPKLLQMVDDKRIAFNPAVELSYLPQGQQTLLLSVIEAEQATPSLAQAQKLKMLSSEEILDEPTITGIMREQKANQKEKINIPYEKVRAILQKDMPFKEMEDFILKAVDEYQRKLMRQKNRDAR